MLLVQICRSSGNFCNYHSILIYKFEFLKFENIGMNYIFNISFLNEIVTLG